MKKKQENKTIQTTKTRIEERQTTMKKHKELQNTDKIQR